MATASKSSQNVAEFKLFKGGATLFGEAAIVAGQELGYVINRGQDGKIDVVQSDGLEDDLTVKAGFTKTGDFYLKVSQQDIDSLSKVFEGKGWDVVLTEPAKKAYLNLNNRNDSVTVYGTAALAIAQEFGFPIGRTDSDKPRVNFEKSELDAVRSFLDSRGYHTEEKEIEHKNPPKATIFQRDLPDGSERFYVFDNSARNIAKALDLELQKTPGGRPTLEFDEQEYKGVKKQLKDLGFDLSQKDLNLTAKVATYESPTGVGAVIIGAPAKEVAALLEKETTWTRPSSRGQSLPMLRLKGEGEIEAAHSALEDLGYEVEVEELPSLANMALLKVGTKQALLFGEPAELVAEQLELGLSEAKNGNSLLRLPLDRLDDAIGILENSGYEVKQEPLTAMRSSQSAKPILKQNKAVAQEANPIVPEVLPPEQIRQHIQNLAKQGDVSAKAFALADRILGGDAATPSVKEGNEFMFSRDSSGCILIGDKQGNELGRSLPTGQMEWSNPSVAQELAKLHDATSIISNSLVKKKPVDLER